MKYFELRGVMVAGVDHVYHVLVLISCHILWLCIYCFSWEYDMYPLDWAESTPKIFRLVMVGHSAKFSSSSYNDWSREFQSLTNLGRLQPSTHYGTGWV